MELSSAAVGTAHAPAAEIGGQQQQQQQQHHHHEIHAIPPKFIQDRHWHYQQVKKSALDQDEAVVDFERGLSAEQEKAFRPVGSVSAQTVRTAVADYQRAYLDGEYTEEIYTVGEDITVYEHLDFPGLRILPGLLPPEAQILFTSQILHRELADPRHKNNLLEDYNVPYPGPRQRRAKTDAVDKEKQAVSREEEPSSFFTLPQNLSTGVMLVPKALEKDKPLNMAQFLGNKLRWLTIGDQYDWPTRSYTRGGPSSFPSDLAKLVQGVFPHIRPESGVVLLYSGKDYMPVHRDVSEECQTALASFSLGCDGIFIVARGKDGGEGEDKPRTVAIRVRSGDCIHLDGEARWAWHAMARTIPGTCPDFLTPWPVNSPGATKQEKQAYQKWKGFMSGKRLNVSCRQVWD